VATFFVGGGFVGRSFLPPAAQQFGTLWVFSRVFAWFNPVLHGFAPGFTPAQVGWLLGVGAAGLGALALSYLDGARGTVGGGQ
jgi:ABC-2 type transport system permease protein